MTSTGGVGSAALLALMSIGAVRTEAAIVLGFHEAQLIAEHTPAFLEAVKKGECPQISDGVLNGPVATFIIRAGCGDYGSGYVLGVYVDIGTGVATKDAGVLGGAEIETPELAKLREVLFAQRAGARITASESMCLLRRVQTSLTGGSACGTVRILREEDNQFVGSVEDSCANSAQRAPLTLRVDRYDGIVTNAQTGEVYKSAAVDSFRASLVAARSPARLTIDDAKRMATAYSASLGARDANCTKVDVDPLYNADEVWLQLSRGCGGRAIVTRLSVNVLTGAIRVIGPNTSPDSAELRTLREKILTETRLRKEKAGEAVRAECR